MDFIDLARESLALMSQHSQRAYEQIYGGGYGEPQQHHKSSFTHELIAGGAGFAAMKTFEDHARSRGEQVSHPFMKELLAGFAAAEVDKLFETKGLDYLDHEKARQRAIRQAHQLADEKYGYGGTYNWQADPYGSGPGAYGYQGAGSYGGPPPYSGPGSYCGPPTYGGPGQYGGAGAYGNN
ncbi:unnamed protein product [Rotaria magnacalcarata]|uniref:Uncharacterized protein n=3 Tax=Rotaria magnacalcarata TaxID=392030 RepID=A0A816GLP2_9BILA|nr:unnamed protein product [Rotaria magnacalcarata]